MTMGSAIATASNVHNFHSGPLLLVGGALFTMPFWLDTLRATSEFAAQAAPVLGCVVGLVTLYKALNRSKHGKTGARHKAKFYDRLQATAGEVVSKPGARSGALLLVLGALALFATMLPGRRADAATVPMALLSSAPAAKPRKRANDDAGEDGEADAVDDPSAPTWYRTALACKGTHEGTKKKPNPLVQAMFADAGEPQIKDTTATPWCAVFVSSMLVRNGYPALPSMMARSGLQYGEKCAPRIGCIVVMWRGSRESSSGHIGLYVGEDATHVHVLGGNQSDSVTVARFAKSKVLGYRWPRKPSQLRTVKAAVAGAASSAAAAVSTATIVAESLAPVQKPLQEIGTPAAMSMAAKIALACALIGLAAALYTAWRRIKDHKERGV